MIQSYERMARASGSVLVASILGIPSAWAAHPDVCAVGCRYATIQDAIQHARPGATIQIAQGVYVENLALTDQAVTLQGAGAELTTLEAASPAPVANFQCSKSSTRVYLADIAIVGGHSDTSPSFNHAGGGIVNSGCSLTIDRSEISGNQAFGSGGGISSSGPLLVRDSVIANNRASNGGGLVLSGNTTILRTLIHGNAAAGTIETSGGGGILCIGTSLFIADSDIVGNGTSISQYRGGGILNNGCTMRVARTRIANNVGMGLVNSGTAQVADSVISDNSVVGDVPIPSPITPYAVIGGYVGGIVNYGTLAVTGSRIADNSGGGIVNYGSLSVGSSVIFHNDGRYHGDDGLGGGLYNVGSAALDGVTVVGNVADSGGGIFNGNAATIAIQRSTVTGNLPDNCAGSGIVCP